MQKLCKTQKDVDISVNCNWVETRWQQYSAHLHTNSTQNGTKPGGSSTVHIYTQTVHRTALNPVAAVQYTFTHKQYTEQHNEREYTERNILKNKYT